MIYNLNNMYTFKKTDIVQTSTYDSKVPFTEAKWLEFLRKLKGVQPVVLDIYEGQKMIGQFTGGIIRFLGIKILGSPFWGWIGQHMGYDLYDIDSIDKSVLLDDLLDFISVEYKVGYIQITDLKYGNDDLKNCKHNLVSGERYTTCYIDLTLSEEQLFKNLKSGYRTCIRKFTKDGGIIEEDYSNDFIDDHEHQLNAVFSRKSLKTPDYRKKMGMMYNSQDFAHGANNQFGIYSIKAILPVEINGETKMKNIASSYYIHNGYMAMFASNASYSDYLKSCPNQALTWHAMMVFKKAGKKVLDMGGSGSYKLNFSGGDYERTPIIIYAKNKWAKFVILDLKHNYGRFYSFCGKIKKIFNNNVHMYI